MMMMSLEMNVNIDIVENKMNQKSVIHWKYWNNVMNELIIIIMEFDIMKSWRLISFWSLFNRVSHI